METDELPAVLATCYGYATDNKTRKQLAAELARGLATSEAVHRCRLRLRYGNPAAADRHELNHLIEAVFQAGWNASTLWHDRRRLADASRKGCTCPGGDACGGFICEDG